MKIIYLSKTLEEKTFDACQKQSIKKINPSNQHFHIKVIKALSTKYIIKAISIVPFKKALIKDETKKQIEFNYINRNKPTKELIEQTVKKCLANINEETILLCDSTSYLIARVAKTLKQKTNCMIGLIVTDNPKYITGMNFIIKKELIKSYKNYDFYISLTEGLNKLTNKEKPNLTFPGLVEDKIIKKTEVKKPYFFYGGSLYKKYGVLDLVKSYLKSSKKDEYDLYISGQGPLYKKLIKISKKYPIIKFMNLLDEGEYLSLISNAFCCINPRPINNKLDENSFPSKVLEYLCFNGALISNKLSCLSNYFNDEISWAENDLYTAIESYRLKDKSELEKIRKSTIKRFGFAAFVKEFEDLLNVLF